MCEGERERDSERVRERETKRERETLRTCRCGHAASSVGSSSSGSNSAPVGLDDGGNVLNIFIANCEEEGGGGGGEGSRGEKEEDEESRQQREARVQLKSGFSPV